MLADGQRRSSLPKIEMCDHVRRFQRFEDVWNIHVVHSTFQQCGLIATQRQDTVVVASGKP